MEEENKKNKVEKQVIIFEKTIDFEELAQWRDSAKDDIPVNGYIAFYRAIGLLDAAEEYRKTHPDFYLYHLDSIFCNFATHKRIKNFIETQWKIFDIDIDADFHTFWNTKKYPKGTQHYTKKLSKKVEKCLAKDYTTYCPGIDDSLEVSKIILVDWVEVEEEPEN